MRQSDCIFERNAFFKSILTTLQFLTQQADGSIIKLIIFPSSWKCAIVVPIHKKGNYFDIANYRPIALLPLFSKVFEKTVNTQLCDFLSESAILHDAQHGFKKTRSCESALLRLSKCLFGSRIAGLWLCLVIIDYSKAFDTLDHDLILQTARTCGFNQTTIRWFESYLTERSQQVKYGSALSTPTRISYGVPQGSVLGPTIFNIFINQLFYCLPADCSIACADDITLISHGDSASSASNCMQVLLDILSRWSLSHKLSINAAKCFCLIISPKVRSVNRPSISLRLSDAPVTQCNCIKILGVTLSDDLKWNTHSKHVRSCVNGMVGVLQRFGPSLNMDARLKIFNTFILPRITYCLPVWGNGSATVASGLSRTLLRSARFVSNNPSAELNKATFLSTGILSFPELVFTKNVTCLFKLLQYQSYPMYLCSELLKSSISQSTRSSEGRKFYTMIHKRQSDEHCFQCQAIRHWNSLPASITSLTNLGSFKNLLSKHILSQMQ